MQPGVFNLDVSFAAEQHGLYYAPDPSSQSVCTIGGNVAFNSGGAHCFKYGMTLNHVLGLRAVLPTGEVITLGGRSLEQVGSDLTGAYVGSEGLFGIALEPFSDRRADIVDNRLAVPLQRVRLLMQPQVQWEPVRITPNENVPTLVDEIVGSTTNGGPTLLGARSVRLVPALPGVVSDGIVDAIQENRRAAALFSLPFGLRAMARLSPNDRQEGGLGPGVDTALHEPDFGRSIAARQVRLVARDIASAPEANASRYMPGVLRQLANFEANQSGLAGRHGATHGGRARQGQQRRVAARVGRLALHDRDPA